jgi:NAD(P)H dehydrogenase (quinone)
MYAVMGITGQIGSVIGRTLLAAKQPVRAVVRDAGKAQVWADRRCEIVLANIEETASLANHVSGAEAVFILVPPNFDPAPEFPEARELRRLCGPRWKLHVRRESFTSPRLARKASQSNPLTQHTIIEATLGELPMPITFLRPAWFMESSSGT